MNTSTIEARGSQGKRLGVFLLGLAVACAGMFGLASSKAEAAATNQPFTMELNDALLNLGFAFTEQEILPAPSTVNDAPLPNWWDIVDSIIASGGASNCTDPTNANYPCGANPAGATVSAVGGAGGLPFGSSTWNPSTGEVELDRVVTAGSSPSGTPFNYDVRFPIMTVISPSTGSEVPLTLTATGALTGTYSEGELTLTPEEGSTLESRVLIGLGIPEEAGGPQPFTYCKVDLPEATLSTGVTDSPVGFDGSAFNFGLEGPGAFQGSWSIESAAPAVPVVQGRGEVANDFTPADAAQGAAKVALIEGTEDSDPACPVGDVNAAINLAVGGAGATWMGNRTDVPKCAANEAGLFPNCVVRQARISKVAVTGPNKVKAGKKVKLTVRVTNSGTGDTSVTLRLFPSSGIAKVQKNVTLSVAAGATARKNVTVTAKKGKKGKVVISATNGSRTGSKKLTVRR